MTARPTRIYALWDILETKLNAATWTGDTPQISVGDPGSDLAREAVVIQTANVGDTQKYRTYGVERRRDEETRIEIAVVTRQPGMTNAEVRTRLKALTDVVESVVRTDPAMGAVDGVVWGETRGVDPRVFQLPSEGWVGFCRITVFVKSSL